MHLLAERLDAAKKSQDFGSLLADYEHLVRAHPDDLGAAEALFAIHFAMKRYGECRADLDHISDISTKSRAPDRRFAIIDYDRALIHHNEHDYTAEAADLERGVKTDQTYTPNLNALAWLRATNPDPRLQNSEEAFRLAQQAVQTGGRHFSTVDTLAAAYAAQGKYSRAVSLQKEAIALINQNATDPEKLADALKRANARLHLYTHNEPDREVPPNPTS